MVIVVLSNTEEGLWWGAGGRVGGARPIVLGLRSNNFVLLFMRFDVSCFSVHKPSEENGRH